MEGKLRLTKFSAGRRPRRGAAMSAEMNFPGINLPLKPRARRAAVKEERKSRREAVVP